MKSSSMLLVGGVVAAGLLLTKAAKKINAVKRLTYKNPKIKVAKLSFSGLELAMTMDFVNDSSEDIPIEYFTGSVQYQGSDLSKFTFNGNGKNIIIKARTTTNVPFIVVVKSLGAIATISKIVKAISKKTPVSTIVNVDGIFSAAGVDMPVKFAYDLKTQSLAGIGAVSARLEFKSNAEMERYFDNVPKKLLFSKN